MKKTVLLLSLAALSAFTACMQEKDNMGVDLPQMTVRASIPEEPLSKAVFTVPDVGEGLHLKWTGTDAIRVFNHGNPSVYEDLFIQPGYTDHQATFSGNAVAGTTYDILSPGNMTLEEAEAGVLATLTQNGNGSTSHLVFVGLLENVPVTSPLDVSFTRAWAESHSGTTLKRGGVLKLSLTLPNAVTSPKKVLVRGIGPVVTLNLTNIVLDNHVLTAYAPCGWTDIPLVAGESIFVTVTDEDGSVYLAEKTIPQNVSLEGGKQNSIRISDAADFVEQPFAGGDGTQANPYLIANAKHLGNMYDATTVDWQKKYFLLINDIDMKDYLQTHVWKPLNNNNSYRRPIHLDGGGHTIDHFSINKTDNTNNHCGFFGVLYGEVCNLTFTNASIQNSYNVGTGILASFCGYSGSKQTAHVYNVHLQGTVIFTGSGNQPVGGLAGRMDNAVIESCSANVHVWSGLNDVGGLVGLDIGGSPSTPSIIRNCWTSGTVRGNQRVGGIIGSLATEGSQILNSFSTVEMDKSEYNNADKEVAQGGNRGVGGIAGFAVLGHTGGNGAGARDEYPNNHVEGCIAWQTNVGQTSTGEAYPAGAIIGYTSIHNYLANCWRNPNMVLSSLGNDVTLEDQNDASPTVDLVVTNPAPSTYHYLYPYHGKAAASGKTLSQVADAAGWSHVAWNLSGSTPVITGNLDASEVPSSGAGSFDVPTGRSTAPTHPVQGGSWTVVQQIADGITYYHYENLDDDTYTASDVAKFYDENQKIIITYFDGSGSNKNTHQNVFVVDVDLNNPAYEVKIVRTKDDIATSAMFAASNAWVAINGAYERNSIAERDNAYYYPDDQEWNDYPNGYPATNQGAPADKIGETDVDNWKSQATLYCDGHRGVRIAFDGYDPAKAAASINPPLKTAAESRYFYNYVVDDPGYLSSAPMLIDNFNNVGSKFHGTWYTGSVSLLYGSTYNAESPYRHQRSLYPRTAVALTSDNHLLLFACDGRYKKNEGGTGMSAGWVAKFLLDNFNAQYAINLDGGGSTTMCVRGASDAAANGVVNYPSENYTGKSGVSGVVDHSGERPRNCFIVIVPKK